MNKPRNLVNALLLTIFLSLLSGCNTKKHASVTAELADIKSILAQVERANGESLSEVKPIDTEALDRISLDDIKEIAKEGYIYGLPIVMNYAVMNEFTIDKSSGQYKATFNKMFNDTQVFTYKDTAVVTPNSDTPYSMLWLDLRAEPMVISVPAVSKERYYSVQFVDGNTYNYGYIGSRATGTEPGNYLVVGPDWNAQKPAGIKKIFQSTTPFSLSIFRTQLFNAEDMPNVTQIQAEYKAQPLSTYLKQPPAPPATEINFLPATSQGVQKHFYTYLDAALQFVPISPENQAIRSRLAKIGVGSSKSFKFKDLPQTHKTAVRQAMKEGDEKINHFLATGMKHINGWKIASLFGDHAFYNHNWLKRAAAAKAGIYGNDAVEAMYPVSRTDANGERLDGSKHNYTLTFPAGQLPPVNAFWSVTMYDGETQFLIKNPINRYLINSPMLPKMNKNADGSLTLYIQKDAPEKALQANWLPAPDGPIYLVMRLYWPKQTPPSILPAGKGGWAPAPIILEK